MRYYLLVASVALLASACATPDSTSQSLAASESDDDDLICRTERPLGSRLGVRVCRTREEIEQQRQLDQEAIDRNRAQGPAAPPLPRRDTGGGFGGPD